MAAKCEAVQVGKADGVGFEQMPKTPGNSGVAQQGDVKTDVNHAAGGFKGDPRLAQIINMWWSLPEAVRDELHQRVMPYVD